MFAISLIVNILAPILFTVILFCIDKFTPFNKIKPIIKKVIFGVILGAVGIAVSEFAIPYKDAFLSSRNATIILSGLIFGWPSGLISGAIVLIERAISSIWTVDSTSLIATIIGAGFSGIYAALLSKFFFKNKRSGFLFSTVCAVVADAFTLLLILLINLSNSGEALTYIVSIVIPQISLSAGVGFVAALLVELTGAKSFIKNFKEKKEIALKIQNLMLAVVTVLFVVSVGAIYAIEDNKAKVETNDTLTNAVESASLDVDIRMNVDISNSLYFFENSVGVYLKNSDTSLYHDMLLDIISNMAMAPVSFAQIIDSNGNVIESAHYFDMMGEETCIVVPENFNYFDLGSESDEYFGFKKFVKDYTKTVTYSPFGFCVEASKLSSDFYKTPFTFDFSGENLVSKISVIGFNYNMYDYTSSEVETWYILAGFEHGDYSNMFRNHASGLTQNTRVGKTGVSLIYECYRHFDDPTIWELDAISGPNDYCFDYDNPDNPNYSSLVLENLETILSNENFSQFEFSLRDEEGIAMISKHYDEIFDSYTFNMAIVSKREMSESRDNAILISSLLQVLIFAVLFAFIYFLINLSVVKPLDDVTGSLNKISGGNLNEVVDVKNSKEFVELSGDINKTVDTLKDFIEKEKNRLATDLALAKSIQKNALPSTYPNESRLTIAASMNTAKEVGGDFYDFYIPKPDQYNILIADVSGKGVPAAMFMMRAKTQLKSLSEKLIPLSDVFNQANQDLCNGNDAEMFVTTWQGNVNLKTGLMTFINAGHNPIIVKHKDGKFEFVKTKVGFVLAGLDMFNYVSQEYQLEKGDIIFLYTDGITEANNEQKELFGETRLLESLNRLSNSQLQPEIIIQEVLNDVNKFVGEADQFDDETMVCFMYNGNK